MCQAEGAKEYQCLEERERDLGQSFQGLQPPWIHFLSLQLLQVPSFPQNEKRNGKGEKIKCFTQMLETGGSFSLSEAQSSFTQSLCSD